MYFYFLVLLLIRAQAAPTEPPTPNLNLYNDPFQEVPFNPFTTVSDPSIQFLKAWIPDIPETLDLDSPSSAIAPLLTNSLSLVAEQSTTGDPVLTPQSRPSKGICDKNGCKICTYSLADVERCFDARLSKNGNVFKLCCVNDEGQDLCIDPYIQH